MKLLYISNARIPSRKVYSIQVMKMCDAFAGAGLEVELVLPKQKNKFKKNIKEYYNIKHNFKINYLPVIDLKKFGSWGYKFQSLFFSLQAFFYAIHKKYKIIFFRDSLPLYFLKYFKKKVFWEIHNNLYNHIVSNLINKSTGVISISNGLERFCLERGGKRKNIMVSHNAVDFSMFHDNLPDKKECRRIINLPLNKKIVVYSGHLYEWKGVGTLVGTLDFLKRKNILLVFIGRLDNNIKHFFDTKDERILLLGQKSYYDIPFYLRAADVLVLPNSAKFEVSKFYTSPVKLFEYMASGTPIVSSNIPSIKEVLNSKNSVLVNPDDKLQLAKGIQRILDDEELGKKISFNALNEIKENTWEKRAKNIINFMDSF